MVHPRPGDAAAQGRSSSCKLVRIATLSESYLCIQCHSVDNQSLEGSKRTLESSQNRVQCSQGSDFDVVGLVPRYPVQKPPSRGLEGSGGEGRGGRRSEGRRGLHLRKASRGLQGGFKGASRGLEGGLKGASPSEGFKGA